MRASAKENHSARSTSGNACRRPGPRGPLNCERHALGSHSTSRSPGRAPDRHDLAALLAHRAQLDERLAGDRSRHADLLLELPQRHLERILPRLVLALGDRPDARILPREERATRMDEQHLRATDRLAGSVEQESLRSAVPSPTSLGDRPATGQPWPATGAVNRRRGGHIVSGALGRAPLVESPVRAVLSRLREAEVDAARRRDRASGS